MAQQNGIPGADMDPGPSASRTKPAASRRSVLLAAGTVSAGRAATLAAPALAQSLAADAGGNVVFAVRHLLVKDTQRYHFAGTHNTMAPAPPYAIAGGMAVPGRQVVAVAGDGSFTTLMGEFATAAKYGLPITAALRQALASRRPALVEAVVANANPAEPARCKA